jgi:hypothetical protein
VTLPFDPRPPRLRPSRVSAYIRQAPAKPRSDDPLHLQLAEEIAGTRLAAELERELGEAFPPCALTGGLV